MSAAVIGDPVELSVTVDLPGINGGSGILDYLVLTDQSSLTVGNATETFTPSAEPLYLQFGDNDFGYGDILYSSGSLPSSNGAVFTQVFASDLSNASWSSDDLTTLLGQTIPAAGFDRHFEMWMNPSSGSVTFDLQAISFDQISGSVGTSYCSAAPNSTGVPGTLAGAGSPSVGINTLALTASDLPPLSFGFLLASQTQDFVQNPGGSAGNLCLGGEVGRFVGAGEVSVSSTSGESSIDVDLTSIPTPTGFVVGQPGETWSFQHWHRDSVGGTATSNFTSGLEITLQ